MFGLGIGETVLIVGIVILFFGGSKLPQLGSALGKSIKNFKKGMKEDEPEIEEKSKDQDNQ